MCGGSGEGKTTLCLQLALHAALELGVSVLYVDPVGSLNHLRMNPVVEALPQDLEACGPFWFFLGSVTGSMLTFMGSHDLSHL